MLSLACSRSIKNKESFCISSFVHEITVDLGKHRRTAKGSGTRGHGPCDSASGGPTINTASLSVAKSYGRDLHEITVDLGKHRRTAKAVDGWAWSF